MEKIIKLIKAICIRVQDLEGYINKTKLIKLLYLIDVEYYRRYKKTFTGFNWIFYEFGPWAYEYNKIYDEIKNSTEFEVKESDYIIGEKVLKSEFIKCLDEYIQLEDIFPSLEEKLIFQRVIDSWGKEELNQILNHVYFQTEPMINAVRGRQLDFSNIEKYGEIPEYKLRKSTIPQKKLIELRKKLRSLMPQKEITFSKIQTRARYDELYWAVMEKLDKDYNY